MYAQFSHYRLYVFVVLGGLGRRGEATGKDRVANQIVFGCRCGSVGGNLKMKGFQGGPFFFINCIDDLHFSSRGRSQDRPREEL